MKAVFIEIAIEKAQANQQRVALQGLRDVVAAYPAADAIFGYRINASKAGNPKAEELE